MAAIVLERQDQVVGLRLLDIERNEPRTSASGTDEVILSFENGKELLIFVDDEGVLHVEGD